MRQFLLFWPQEIVGIELQLLILFLHVLEAGNEVGGCVGNTGIFSRGSPMMLQMMQNSFSSCVAIGWICKGITQTLIPNTLAVKPKVSQSTDGNLLWSVVYISDTAYLCAGPADDTQPALADPHPLRWPWPVTGRYAAGVS
jgi:hypothetical protein